ncbi:MAG: cell division protein ZapB [Spirochaetes bacterium]|nr:cell division protein ZapB [Spirochaetota bacterium]
MIRIDQIKILEDRVNRAIELIKTLREENRTLRAGLDSAQSKIDELEGLVDTFKSEQSEIEEGILRALENLDKIEDEVFTAEGINKNEETTGSPAEPKPSSVPPEKNSELDIF